MKKSLLKQIEAFEKIVTYNNRSFFLHSLGQKLSLDDNYPELKEIVSMILSNPSDSPEFKELKNLAMNLFQEIEKEDLNLSSINSVVSEIATKSQKIDSNVYQISSNLKSKILSHINPVLPKPLAKKIDTSPKYNPVDTSINPPAITEAEKLLLDWKNPTMQVNQNSLNERTQDSVFGLNKLFNDLKSKEESINAIPGSGEKDLEELNNISSLKRRVFNLLSQLSTVPSSGQMAKLQGPR